MRRRLWILGLLVGLIAPLRGLCAQVQLEVVVSGGSLTVTDPPSIVGTNLLADPKTRELLRNGFPTRLHYRAELWRVSGWFNERESVTEWDIYVSYDPASQQYRVARQHGKQFDNFGGFSTLTAAEEPLALPYRVELRPRSKGRRYYYNVALDIETLSVSDLDELQRWLRGEFQPAVRGRNNPANAIKNGVGTLLSRILGGERRHYERRSETFRSG